jgi:hypothetical protein
MTDDLGKAVPTCGNVDRHRILSVGKGLSQGIALRALAAAQFAQANAVRKASTIPVGAHW